MLDAAVARIRLQADVVDTMRKSSGSRPPAQDPVTTTWYVSYARAANTAARGQPVDRFCTHIRQTQPDVALLRDEEQIRYTDSIERFITALAAGERIFLFLSPDYFMSAFCMRELHGIWKTSKDHNHFAERTVAILDADVRQMDIAQMNATAAHWKDVLATFPPVTELSGERLEDFLMVAEFANYTYDILHTLFDHVTYRTLEEVLADV